MKSTIRVSGHWRENMEEELAALRNEVESLRRDLDEFRGQF